MSHAPCLRILKKHSNFKYVAKILMCISIIKMVNMVADGRESDDLG